MTKRYLLLRNNRESGPFSFDELLQQQLVPGDLLWVEGESQEWKYFREIIDLGFAKLNIHQPPFPEEITVKDGGEIKTPTLSYHSNDLLQSEDESKSTFRDPSSTANKPRSFLYPLEKPEEEEENIEFIYHKRKNPNSIVQFSVLALVILVLAIGWRRNGSFFKQKEAIDQAAIPLISSTEHAAMEAKTASPFLSAPAVQHDSLGITTPAPDSSASTPEKPSIKKETHKQDPIKVRKRQVKKIILLPDQRSEAKLAVPELSIPVVSEQQKEIVLPQPQETNVASDKKKSFGQVLKGLFRKKRKEEKPSLME